MTPYTEDTLVQQTMAEYLYKLLGWKSVYAHNNEDFGLEVAESDLQSLRVQLAVEHIGSGIRRIRDLCREHGVAEPQFAVSEHWVTTTFPRPTEQVVDTVTAQVELSGSQDGNARDFHRLQKLAGGLDDLTAQVTAQVAAQVVHYCETPRAAREIMELLGLRHWKTFRSNYLQPLIDDGWLEMTIPDKPTSSRQKYRLTPQAIALLAELGQEQE